MTPPGIVFLFDVDNTLNADPNDPLAAFTEYAANCPWVASRVIQLFGIILIVVALVLLSRRMAIGSSASWVAVGVAGAVAGMIMAYASFSDSAMTLNVAASFLLLVWMPFVGVWMWRPASATSSEQGTCV